MTQDETPVMLLVGGSGSIGAAIAARALGDGWRIALHGRTQASIDAVATRLGGDEPHVFSIAKDIAEPDAARSIVAAAADRFGRIDAVVDCVAAGPRARLTGAFDATAPEAYVALLDLSLAHLERLAHAAAPWLQKRGGTFVSLASDAGKFAAPRQALIGASRAGMIGFVRNLAVEWASLGVRVHCISPSFVDATRAADMLQQQNAARLEAARAKAGLGLPTPADIAPLVLFFCSDDARKITGQIISINGGLNA